MPTATAVPTTISWLALSTRMPTLTVPSPPKRGRIRGSLGGQTALARPIRTSSRPRVTASVWSAGAPEARRKSTRSTTTPNSGASTKTTSGSASQTGSPQPCHSCQNEKAATMPIAPCAKLKTPAVV